MICPYFDKLSKVKYLLFLNGNKILLKVLKNALFSLMAGPLPRPPPLLMARTSREELSFRGFPNY